MSFSFVSPMKLPSSPFLQPMNEKWCKRESYVVFSSCSNSFQGQPQGCKTVWLGCSLPWRNMRWQVTTVTWNRGNKDRIRVGNGESTFHVDNFLPTWAWWGKLLLSSREGPWKSLGIDWPLCYFTFVPRHSVC